MNDEENRGIQGNVPPWDLLIVISAGVLIFGYRIRELWPATVWMYEVGIPDLFGMAGVTFFLVGNVIFFFLR